MTSDIDKGILEKIRTLYKQDEIARRFFDQCASRERDASATSIDRMTYLLGISREEAVGLAQKLESTGCGEFIVGRRGYKSRFTWSYSCISVGQAAAGETAQLEPTENPEPEGEDQLGREVNVPAMTIQDAKRALSVSLGVPESAIEILIRA